MRNQPNRRTAQGRQRGIAVIATAAWLTIAVPFIGLGIDTGVLWGAQARITSACAAASLAAARNLAKGDQLEQQMANATARGKAFFKANFPPGSYGTAEVKPTIQVLQPTASMLQVSATASANVPLYFLRYLGPDSAKATSIGKSTRRDVNLMIVLDRSNSCVEMKKAAESLVGNLMSGRDRIGLVASAIEYAPDKNFLNAPAFAATLNRLNCDGAGNIDRAYKLAVDQLTQLSEPMALNLVVLLSGVTPTPSAIGVVTHALTTPAEAQQLFARISGEIYHLTL